ncbi:MAG: beta-galactosidase trimerization domain-containing protein [Chloroflexi bacterium]|nr:beta-galactosidase trimerization domain-containing protein [Chloroflexota bacterium]
MSWFNESLLKPHILYVSPDWVPDRGEGFDADAIVRLLKDAGISALELYCKDVHGVSYYPSQVELGPQYPRDVTGELCRASHAAGIKFIAYYSIGWDGRVGKYHPEWLMRTSRQEELKIPGHWNWVCINTGYGQYVLDKIAELADLYEIDGLFIDIFVDNFSACYCPVCNRLFQERYGIPMPVDLNERRNIAMIKRFQADYHHEYLQRIAHILEQRRPAAQLTFNGVGAVCAHNRRFSELAGWHSVESHAPDFLAISRTCKILRSQGKPFEITTPGLVKCVQEGGDPEVEELANWSSMIPKPASTLRIEASIALSHSGTTTVGLNLRADGSLQERESQPLLEAGRWVAERRHAFEDTVPVSDAAVLWNERTCVFHSIATMDKRWGCLSGDEDLRGIHAGLVGHHTQFDIMREDLADFGRYRLIILPDRLVTDGTLEDRLRTYVGEGGTLMACYEASLIDESGSRRADFGLADVLGVQCAGSTADRTCFVQPMVSELERDLSHSAPVMARGQAIEINLSGAVALAAYVPPIGERTAEHYIWTTPYNWPGTAVGKPAITLNHFGRGQCMYIGFPIGTNLTRRLKADPWLDQLLANLVDYLLPNPFLRVDAPRLVEVIANRRQTGYAIHLVNYYGGVEGFYYLADRVPHLTGLRLKLARERLPHSVNVRIATKPSGTVAHRWEDDYLIIDLPPLDDHMTVLVD